MSGFKLNDSKIDVVYIHIEQTVLDEQIIFMARVYTAAIFYTSFVGKSQPCFECQSSMGYSFGTYSTL